MRRFINYWLPPILWAAVILLASSDAFSGANTEGVLGRILAWLTGHRMVTSTVDTMNFTLRKTSHLLEYGLLGALLFRALRGGQKWWSWGWSIGAVLLAVCVASADEIHQSFVPSRTGTWHDVILDMAGAALAQILIRAAQVLLFRP